MARPKNVPDGESLRRRLEETLVEMVREEPLERISIGALSSKAGCSRGAFYYHYEDIYDLFDGMLARCVPVEWIGTMAGAILAGGLDGPKMKAGIANLFTTHKADMDRLCVLLGSKAGDRVMSVVKSEVVGVWAKALGRPAFEGDERLLFEFAFNGILGVLAFGSSRGEELDYHRVLGIVTPELPMAFAACLEKCGSKAQGGTGAPCEPSANRL